ncbi:NAD-dependent epimerase/dehydratase family protein [Spiribacter sp. 221]|uniref:NAD-dependent epimerase/dehydratase family protein n=1 Tax=Spiribacter onubensis TaxID=3122420 RepID=UPI00349F3CBA
MYRPCRPLRVVSTGANGFVGRALAPALAADGHWVAAAVRSLPRDPAVSPAPGMRSVAIGALDGEMDWRDALSERDAVIHLAAAAHQRTAGQSPQALRAINVEATEELARQARAAGVRHFIFLSSIGVLGQSSVVPLDESAPLAPAEPYARTKAEAEAALWALADDRMAVTVIRPPLVHGPGAPGNFGRLLDWADDGRALPLAAVTHNRRSFAGRANLVDFIRHVLINPAARNQTFHVCDEQTLSTAELLRTLAHAAGRRPGLFPVPPPILRAGARLLGRGDTIDRLLGSLTVDSGKARTLLGWHPPWTLQQGLRHAVAGHRAAAP